MEMNDLDSLKQASLIYWNDEIKNYVIYNQNGTYPKQGFINAIIQSTRTNQQIAKAYCSERLNFYSNKFKRPIDFFYYRDNCYYGNNSDNDDDKNRELLLKKYNLK
jgi:hypothetical protein